MEKVLLHILMEINMQEKGKKGKDMEKVRIHGQMVQVRRRI